MAEHDESPDSGIKYLWNRLSRVAKWSLGLGACMCLGIALLVLWWATRADYQILFSNMEEADAAVVVQELKEQKTSYRLSSEGRTISVPADRVYETRLALMSGGVPLTGGVGFEIFDRQGLGATEHSQRVAYQRALQGELARTIGALEHVRQARVLLVLPESTLFKRDQQKPRAAVSMVLEPGASLQAEQVVGVQRLVAASVGGMDVDQVVITDQRGITLSAPSAGALESAASETRLKLKDELEKYFTRKVSDVLARVVGPGQAIVSVDAALNFDQITHTLQTIVPVDSGSAEKNGGLVRRRESRTRAPGPVETAATGGGAQDSTSIDVEYEFGKRLEQVATAPGTLVRLSVGVIVPGPLTPERESRLLQLVRATVGIDTTRGDAVVVDSLDRIASPTNSIHGEPEVSATVDLSPPRNDTGLEDASAVSRSAFAVDAWVVFVGLLTVLLSLAAAAFLWRRRNQALSPHAREALLADIVATLDGARSDAARHV